MYTDRSDNFLVDPVTEVDFWLAKNGSSREACGMCPDVVLASPLVFNTFTALSRQWDLDTEIVPVVWEPGVDAGVIRAVRVSSGGSSFLLYRISTASSIAADQLERLIAVGGSRFFYIGYADPITNTIASGSILLVSDAVGDDGISRQYTPQNDRVPADPLMTEQTLVAALELGVILNTASVWTIDALFRRSRKKAEDLASEGVAVVDTVVSALFSISSFRGTEISTVVVTSGDPAGAVDEGTKDACRLAAELFLSR